MKHFCLWKHERMQTNMVTKRDELWTKIEKTGGKRDTIHKEQNWKDIMMKDKWGI